MSLIVPFLPYIIAACLSLGGWLWADHGWCNGACKSQKSRADKLQTTVDAAQKRATDLALLYANTLTKADKETQDALTNQRAQFSTLASDASHLNALPSIVISGDAWRVLDSASDLANATTAPTQHQDTPAAISESALTEKWNAAASAYADARQKWASCVNLYESLSHEQVH